MAASHSIRLCSGKGPIQVHSSAVRECHCESVCGQSAAGSVGRLAASQRVSEAGRQAAHLEGAQVRGVHIHAIPFQAVLHAILHAQQERIPQTREECSTRATQSGGTQSYLQQVLQRPDRALASCWRDWSYAAGHNCHSGYSTARSPAGSQWQHKQQGSGTWQGSAHFRGTHWVCSVLGTCKSQKNRSGL